MSERLFSDDEVKRTERILEQIESTQSNQIEGMVSVEDAKELAKIFRKAQKYFGNVNIQRMQDDLGKLHYKSKEIESGLEWIKSRLTDIQLNLGNIIF